MDTYVHVTLRTSNDRVLVVIEAFEYDTIESNMCCTWSSACRTYKKKLWRNNDDVRCFDCVPWGNRMLSDRYVRVGKYLFEMYDWASHSMY